MPRKTPAKPRKAPRAAAPLSTLFTCPGCGRGITQAAYNAPVMAGDGWQAHAAHQCPHCEALFGEMYLGESYALVLPRWETADVPPEQTRYFDFTTLGSAGIGRRHGWYNPATRLVVQTG